MRRQQSPVQSDSAWRTGDDHLGKPDAPRYAAPERMFGVRTEGGMGEWVPVGSTGHRAYLAAPEHGAAPGVLVLHAWWGLTPVFTDVCDRLAGAGYVAL